MALQYFVEHLARIGSVSILVQSDCSENLEVEELTQVDERLIKLQSSSSGKTVLFIPLPINVPPVPNLEACYIAKNDTITIRLPVSTQNDLNRSTNQLMSMSSNYKWSCKYLQNLKTDKYILKCVSCDVKIMDSSNVEKISEMPSEMWAEMMDFWHCHKPHDQNDIKTDKFSSLKPVTNGLITGSYYFAFNLDDELMHNLERMGNKIYCCACHTLVGEFDKSSGLYKIFKWSVKLSYDSTEEIFKPFNHIYSVILDNVNSNATRIIEFVNEDETRRLLIWVFNIGVDFIVSGSNASTDGLKVYYTTDKDNIEEERSGRGEIELINISDVVLSSAIDHLESFNRNLPVSLRAMGRDWKLGLIASN